MITLFGPEPFDLILTDFGVASSLQVPLGGGGARPPRPYKTPRRGGARGVVAGAWRGACVATKGRRVSVETPIGDLIRISSLNADILIL